MHVRKNFYLQIVPAWLRFGSIAAAIAATCYLAFEDRQPFRAIWLLFSSYQLGFLITLLVFLLPIMAGLTALAWFLHRRRRLQDFPAARVVDRG